MRRNKRSARIVVATLVALTIYVVSRLSLKNYSGLGFDKNASSVNTISGPLWYWAWITAGFVGVLTFVLIMWPVVFHRKKGDEFPKQTQYNVPVEIAYTLIPLIIVAGLFFYTARDESKITKVDSYATAPHNIHVNAQQWSWQFIYDDAGTGPNATVTGTPAQRPVLYMPLGQKVLFDITSSDVDHGFWIPDFMIQIQALPGVANHLEFAATKLGTYPGRCNILCGRNHSQMLFTVKVVTPDQYQSYINTLKAAA